MAGSYRAVDGSVNVNGIGGANGVNGAASQAGRGVSMMGAAADARAMSAQNVNANVNAQGRMNAYRQGSVGVENRSVVAGRNGVNGMAGGNGNGNGYGVGAVGANGINGVHGGNGMAGSYRAVGGSVNVNGMGGANGVNGVGSVGATGRGSAGMNGAGGYRVNNTQNAQTNVAGNRYAMPSTPNINVANAARGGNAGHANQRGYMPPRNANRQMPNPVNGLPNEGDMPTGPARGVGSINPVRTHAGGQVGGRGSYGRMQQPQGAYKNTAGTNDFV
jgi:hypothetical protein